MGPVHAPRMPDLEARIREAPRDPASYLVYADWLQAAGDPRGELIAIQHALLSVESLTALEELRRREEDLLARHQEQIFGAANRPGLAPVLHLGFVSRILVYGNDGLEACVELLATDDAATQFLASIVAEQMHLDTLRPLVAGRSIALLSPDEADQEPIVPRRASALVFCRREGDQVGVFVSLGDAVPSGPFGHAYLSRTSVETASTTRVWWFGSGADVTEESLGDNPPSTGEGLVPAGGTARLSVLMRLRVGDERIDTFWLAIDATIDLDVEAQAVLVTTGTPAEGPCFEHTALPTRSPRTGAVLLAPSDEAVEMRNPGGAVLPGLGVFDERRNALLSEGQAAALPRFDPPVDCYRLASYGGPDGVLCLSTRERDASSQVRLTFVRLPGGTPRHLKTDPLFTGAFDETGRLFAALTYDHLRIIEVETLREVAAAPIGGNFLASEPYLGWWNGSAFAYRSGTLSILDPSTRQLGTKRAPNAVGYYGRRHYGAGVPAYHPAADRVAWMMCVEHAQPELDQPGTTLIGWMDGDGQHGTVVVPDHGWAQDRTHFGNVAVLPDRRIVAIGTRIWLVEDGSVEDLGPSGDYPRPLPITRVDGALRLWSRGPGPVWTSLD